jgi:hypothetical protein
MSIVTILTGGDTEVIINGRALDAVAPEASMIDIIVSSLNERGLPAHAAFNNEIEIMPRGDHGLMFLFSAINANWTGTPYMTFKSPNAGHEGVMWPIANTDREAPDDLTWCDTCVSSDEGNPWIIAGAIISEVLHVIAGLKAAQII